MAGLRKFEKSYLIGVRFSPKDLDELIVLGYDKDDLAYKLASLGRMEEVDYLLRKGADVSFVEQGLAINGNVDCVKYFVKFGLKKKNLLAHLCFCGQVEAVDYLLANGESRVSAMHAYLISGHLGYAKALLPKEGPGFFAKHLYVNPEVCSYIAIFALKGHSVEVNALLKRYFSFTSFMSIYCDYQNSALRGYAEGKYYDEFKKLKIVELNRARFLKSCLVLLFAFLLTPISLLITFPLWYWAKRTESVQKLTVSISDYNEVKRRRQALRGDQPKIHDPQKPKKLLLSSYGSQRVYLVDRAQRDRYLFFSENNVVSLLRRKSEVEKFMRESRSESKRIVWGLTK